MPLTRSTLLAALAALAASLFAAAPAAAQQMSCSDSGGKMGDCKVMEQMHDSMMSKMHGMMPAPSGSGIFDALSAEVAHLEADSSTDWSKVDLEALRQHLIDMNEVMLNASVVQKPVAGGVTMTITGTGRTVGSIQRMLTAHMKMLQQSGKYLTTVKNVSNGVVATVTAPAPAADAAVAKIRGLGFAGLMTEGTHHGRHHRAMAHGDSMPHAH